MKVFLKQHNLDFPFSFLRGEVDCIYLLPKLFFSKRRPWAVRAYNGSCVMGVMRAKKNL